MSVMVSKIKYRKMKKNLICGNGFNGCFFLLFLYLLIELMKIELKFSFLIIIIIICSKECCMV